MSTQPCPDCRRYADEDTVHTQPLAPIYHDRRTYPVTVRVKPPRSFSQGFGGTLGVAAGLLVAAWILSKLGD